MRKKSIYVFLLASVALIHGCASIEGTRDKSTTIKRSVGAVQIDSIAILPIKENAAIEGLSSKIEYSLSSGLKKSLPTANVVDVGSFSSRLAKSGLIQSYGQWASSYEATSILDTQSLPEIQKAANAHYLLLIRSIYLAREKIHAVDAGYSGTVSNANNVYRTDLKVSAELIDATLGRVVWKGVGHAENINSPRKDIDLGLIIFNQKNPEITEFIGPMVQTASEGVAGQIANLPRGELRQ
jgi:hypothetical protein